MRVSPKGSTVTSGLRFSTVWVAIFLGLLSVLSGLALMLVSEATPAYQTWHPPALEGEAEAAIASSGNGGAVGVSSGTSAPTVWEGSIGRGGWQILNALPSGSSACDQDYWSEDLAVAANGTHILVAVGYGMGWSPNTVTAASPIYPTQGFEPPPFCTWETANNGETWTTATLTNFTYSGCQGGGEGMSVALNGDDAVLVWNAGCQAFNGGDQISFATSLDGGLRWNPVESFPVEANDTFPSQVVSTSAGFLATADGYGYTVHVGQPSFINQTGWIGRGQLLGSTSMGNFLNTGSSLVSLDRAGQPSIPLSEGAYRVDSIGVGQTTDGVLLIAGIKTGTYGEALGVVCWSINWPVETQTCNVPFLSQAGLGGTEIGSETQTVVSPKGWSVLDGNGPCTAGLGAGCAPFNLWVIDSHPLPAAYTTWSVIGSILMFAGVVLLIFAFAVRLLRAAPIRGIIGMRQRLGIGPSAKKLPVGSREWLDGGALAYRRALLAWAIAWIPAALLIVLVPTSADAASLYLVACLAPVGALAISFHQSCVARSRLTRAINSPGYYESPSGTRGKSGSEIRSWTSASKGARYLSWLVGAVLLLLVFYDFTGGSYEATPDLILLGVLTTFVILRVAYHWETGRVARKVATIAQGQEADSRPGLNSVALFLGTTLLPLNPAITMVLGISLYGSGALTLYALVGLFPTLAGVSLVSWAWSSPGPSTPKSGSYNSPVESEPPAPTLT